MSPATVRPASTTGTASSAETLVPAIAASCGRTMITPPAAPATARRNRAGDDSPMSRTVNRLSRPMSGETYVAVPSAMATITGRERPPQRPVPTSTVMASVVGTSASTLARASGTRRNANVSGTVSSTQAAAVARAGSKPSLRDSLADPSRLERRPPASVCTRCRAAAATSRDNGSAKAETVSVADRPVSWLSVPSKAVYPSRALAGP